jgi:hypothetical protein
LKGGEKMVAKVLTETDIRNAFNLVERLHKAMIDAEMDYLKAVKDGINIQNKFHYQQLAMGKEITLIPYNRKG